MSAPVVSLRNDADLCNSRDRSCRLKRHLTRNPETSEEKYESEKPEWFTKPLLMATNLRRVDLYLEFYISTDQADLISLIMESPFWLEGCKGLFQLRLHIPVIPWIIHWKKHKKIVQGIFEGLMKKIGVQGNLVEQGDEMFDVWAWEASPGRLMNFAQDLEREWRYPRKWFSLERWHLFDDNGEHLRERDSQFVLED